MKKSLDMDKIAEAIGGKRKGKAKAGAGFFGALQLAAEVEARFKVPQGGGRATDPRWTERRLVSFMPETLEGLDRIAAVLGISRLQVAALILEQALKKLDEDELVQLASGERKPAWEVQPPPADSNEPVG